MGNEDRVLTEARDKKEKVQISMLPRILIVDDALSIRKLIRSYFTQANFQIDEAVNGMEALDKIRENTPDLIILDLLMPVMDGLECCRRIKHDSHSKNIPVVIITSRSLAEEMNVLGESGADLLIQKPLDREKTTKMIHRLLKKE